VHNIEFLGCNSEFAACFVCFALSVSTAAGFLIKIQRLPFVMKQIIHDCDAVPKSLNALVVCSSNIYITKVNCLPNWKKNKGVVLKRTEAETLFCGLHMRSVMYAEDITQTRSNIKITGNTHGFQEWCNELGPVLVYGYSVMANKS